MENVVGQPVKVDTQKAEKGQEADPAKATPLCCTGYATFIIALVVFLPELVGTAMLFITAIDPTALRLLRVVHLFLLALLALIPYSFWLLRRGNQQPVPRGCETCGCACGCAFLPISLVVVAVLWLVALLPNLIMFEHANWEHVVGAVVNVVIIISLGALGGYWLRRLRARDAPLSA
mmetsp:Transcript_53834/g.167045  ORF Transcript_53834/g.167045 Transcript_53834/m.167045 type:complete len:177 (+) Transcript_53834:91-621(+)